MPDGRVPCLRAVFPLLEAVVFWSSDPSMSSRGIDVDRTGLTNRDKQYCARYCDAEVSWNLLCSSRMDRGWPADTALHCLNSIVPATLPDVGDDDETMSRWYRGHTYPCRLQTYIDAIIDKLLLLLVNFLD